MLESWNFNHRPLAYYLKKNGQKLVNFTFTIFDHCATSKMLTLLFVMLESWHFHYIPLADLFESTLVKFFSNLYCTNFDHCTSKMLTLPFFMLESWNFHHRSLACYFSKKNNVQYLYLVKFIFHRLWPVCNIKNANFATLVAVRVQKSKPSPFWPDFLDPGDPNFRGRGQVAAYPPEANQWTRLTFQKGQKYRLK